MIAPARRTAHDKPSVAPELDHARQVVAATLLADRRHSARAQTHVPRWGLLLFALWTSALVGSLIWSAGQWWRVRRY